jgi:hypothetical protein
LQDVNGPDIREFIGTNLEQLPVFQNLVNRDPQGEELAKDIVNKAQGVFLWVHLVVRSLLEASRTATGSSTCKEGLVRDFPSDLGAFFMHIFTSLDHIYRAQTARTFRVAVATSDPFGRNCILVS